METTRRIIAYGHKVALTPSVSRLKGRIFVPDTFRKRTNMCKVLSVGDKVELLKEGDVVLCRGAFTERNIHRIDDLNAFFCDDTNVFAKFIRKMIYPLGRRVLLKREHDERKEGSIIIPAAHKSTDQSLLGTVLGFGMPRGNDKRRIYGINIGDRVYLKEWKTEMIEVSMQGMYCLIVDEEDILYRYENDRESPHSYLEVVD